MKFKKYFFAGIVFITALLISNISFAITNQKAQDPKQWSLLFYTAGTAKQVFGGVIGGKYTPFGENIYAGELAYTLDPANPVSRFFHIIFDKMQVATTLAKRIDHTNHDGVYEGNLFLMGRFTRFPWSNYVRNSVAIGDGISYDSHSPFADRELNVPGDQYSKFLNFLAIEATVGLPAYPNIEAVMRIHHRCTFYNLFPGKAAAGSTAVGFGIRIYF